MTTTQIIPVDHLVEDPDNLRTHYENIDQLAKSIAQVGVLEPLTVRPGSHTEEFIVTDGNRRLRAIAKLNGDGPSIVNCIVAIEDHRDAALRQLISGLQRENLDPLDQAEGITKAIGFGMTKKDLAAAIGYTPAMVAHRLSLLNLPAAWRHQYLKDMGITAAQELGVALGKHPLYDFSDFEVPETVDTDYPAEDWDYRINAEMVTTWGVRDEANRDAYAQAEKINEATPGSAFVANQDDDPLPDDFRAWIRISEEGDEKIQPWMLGNDHVALAKTDLTKVRKSDAWRTTFHPTTGWNDKHQLVAVVTCKEFVTTIDALPEAARPKQAPATSGNSDLKKLQDKEADRRKAETARNKAAKQKLGEQIQTVLVKKLTVAQRNDIVWLGMDALIERSLEAHVVADWLGYENPEKDMHRKREEARNFLADFGRVNSVNRDRVIFGLIAAQQHSGEAWQGDASIVKAIAELAK